MRGTDNPFRLDAGAAPGSEAEGRLGAVAARPRLEHETARREFGIILFVEQILGEKRERPLLALKPEPCVDEVDRVAGRAVRHIPPGATGAAIVEAGEQAEARLDVAACLVPGV